MTTIAMTSYGAPAELPGIDNEELRELYAEAVQEPEKLLARAREKIAEIDRDSRLSGLGKQQAKSELVALVSGAIRDPLKKKIEQLENAIPTHEAHLFAPQVRHRLPGDVDPEDARWAEREARDLLREMDPNDRKIAYLEACRNGDVQTVRAVELAPSIAPIVTPETLEEGRDLFARQHDPERYQILQQQRRVVSGLKYVDRAASEALEELAGTHGAAADDPEAQLRVVNE